MSTSNETAKLINAQEFFNENSSFEGDSRITVDGLRAFQRNAIEFAVQAVNKVGGDNRAIHIKAILEVYAAELKKMEER